MYFFSLLILLVELLLVDQLVLDHLLLQVLE
jgi:hypothetical protein